MFKSDCDDEIFDQVLSTLGEFHYEISPLVKPQEKGIKAGASFSVSDQNDQENEKIEFISRSALDSYVLSTLKKSNSTNVSNQNGQENKRLKHNSCDPLESKESQEFINLSILDYDNSQIVNSVFYKSKKRKFPGPAGLIGDNSNIHLNNGGKDTTLSQDYKITQHQIPTSIFKEGPWCVMIEELIRNNFNLKEHSIMHLKTHITSQKCKPYRVKILAGVIQAIDHNLHDPIITIKDPTGQFQCILHRDAWNTYNTYLIPSHSVLLLKQTSVLIIGKGIENYYLNITLNNISSIYCDEESLVMFNNGKPDITKKDDSYRLDTIDIVKWDSYNIIIVRCFDKDL